MGKFNKKELRDGKVILFWTFAIIQFIAGFILFIITLANNSIPKWTLVFWLPWIVLNCIDMYLVSKNNSKGALQAVGWVSLIFFGLLEGALMIILGDYVPEQKENKQKSNKKTDN